MKEKVLLITYSQSSSIIERSKELYPIEACGVIVGEEDRQQVRVTRVEHTENKCNSSSSFEIDAEKLWEVIEQAEAKGLEFLGFYHSHPAPPSPSSRDLESMERWKGSIWLIVSTIDWSMKAYEARKEELTVEILEEHHDSR